METTACAFYFVTSPPESPVLSSSTAAHDQSPSQQVLADAPSDLEIQESMPRLIDEYMSAETKGTLQLSRQTSVSSETNKGTLQLSRQTSVSSEMRLSRQTSVTEETFHRPRSKNEAFKSVVTAIASNETVWREVLSMEEVQNFLRTVNPGSRERESPRIESVRRRRNTGEMPTCGCGISISIRPMLLKIAEELKRKLRSYLEGVYSSMSSTEEEVVFQLILTVTALILEVAVRRLESLSLSSSNPATPLRARACGGEGGGKV